MTVALNLDQAHDRIRFVAAVPQESGRGLNDGCAIGGCGSDLHAGAQAITSSDLQCALILRAHTEHLLRR
jgi:hypothetical protein